MLPARATNYQEGQHSLGDVLVWGAGDLELSLDTVIHCSMFLTCLNLTYLIYEIELIQHGIQAGGRLK